MIKKEEMKKYIILIIIGISFFFLINNLKIVFDILSKIFTVLLPFILGCVFAFILNIPMTKIENLLTKKIKNKKLIRTISIILSILILISIICFISFLLIPELVNNIELLIQNIPSLFEKVETFILNLLDQYPDLQAKISETLKNNTDISNIISNVLNYIINSAVSFVSALISGIITFFTAIIFAVYMLGQKEELLTGFKKITYAYLNKDKAKKLGKIGNLANDTFKKFVSGSCVEAIILGTLFFIILTIFKFPYALLISVLVSITALIPYFGAFISMAVGAILIAITNPMKALIFLIIFLVIQQIEGNFIYPKVVGKSVGLSPLWTLLAISVGGSLFGVIGMILALPIASILYALLKEDVIERLEIKKKLFKR